MERARPAIEPEAPALRERRALVDGEPDQRVGAVRGGAQQGTDEAPKRRERPRDARRVGPARVHGVHDDPIGCEPLGPQLDERDLGALGSRVGGVPS